MQTNPISVIVLTGFLGSGKTTLLNRLLANGPQTAVIVNEFGSTPVDQRLLETQDMPLMTLAGGCLCCQIKGTLSPTLRNLWLAWQQAESKPFQRMIIETSGVASPEPILDSLLRDRWLASRYRLQRVITTVSIPNAVQQLASFAEVRAQLAWADVLVLTHGDLAEADAQAALVSQLDVIAPATPRHFATREKCDADALLAGSAQTIRRLGAEHAMPEHSFQSISLQLEQPLPWLQLAGILQKLLSAYAVDLLRIKGVVFVQEQAEPLVIQAAAGHLYPPAALPSRTNDDHRGRLVFIFTGEGEGIAEQVAIAFGNVIKPNALRMHNE
jgi:G3E family GTPase